MEAESKMSKKRSELMQDIQDHAADLMLRAGFSAEVAAQVGVGLADRIVETWGGQSITIPVEFTYRLAKKEDAILSKFDGTNCPELAREFSMTERGVRKLLARATARTRTKQNPLFGASV